jgi:hypothetical protein
LLSGEASCQISTRVLHRPPSVGLVAQPINQSMFSFAAQNQENVAVILRHKSPN